MNRSLRAAVLVCLAIGCGWVFTATAQFFPTEQAAWCLTRNNPDGTDQYTLSMVPGQDTVIQGLTYMVIEYTTEWTPTMELWPFSRCYVRNDQDGRGFARVDGMEAEVLIGDVDAQVGEIVQDVAIGDWNCVTSWEYGMLTDMIVDSIVELQENGVQARRVYVQPLCSSGAMAGISFWQTDMGTPFGPILMLNELAGPTPECAAVNDTTRFRLYEELQLGGPLCYCYDLGLGTITLDQAPSLAYWPNPSQGVFRIPSPGSWPLAVYDLHGREVQRLLPYSVEIDLSAQPPGVYTAIIQSPHGRNVQRLVVVRE
ncbi:MAG: T9SS type A sorting domain-containing protein [Flavobacteriales bacterium]|jgi:hypothetical protein|nr:T9SS type A sorting domain-containing protein [Flavobacteriales bacterium]MBK6552006.1 T9SS type A sorting domain-containing protein [Flavobacteriales bacterium]MBK6883350.1 T9SS type A sorting domain-containing protein [Flavobacteriales bacterium]MBK7102994.1 T9SS type A sorting domain-containing protein [Flavobacteriales bacterium]MBK7113904.1 T9SS type A sorting domain-containing protein [Flavobacteriales bacterium]